MPWLLSSGIRVVVVLFVAWLVSQIGKVFIKRIIAVLIKGENAEAEAQREKTLIKVFSSTLKIVVWLLAVMMILPEFGINIAPLLAGAGLVGLAVGMGARSIIQDYLSGLYILLEDQYRVGEEINIAGIKGKVVYLNLRRTVVVDSEKVVHCVPNGQIKTASNLSRK